MNQTVLFDDNRKPQRGKLIPLGPNGELTAIDLFCGAGGVSEGMCNTGVVKVLAAVNHSPEAIAAHKENNPEVMHFTEDIKDYQAIFPYLPRRVNILWASAECTNHSNAKGGESRKADSRSLPRYLDKYVQHTNPDYFMVENVVEFMNWGPLKKKRDKQGRIVYEKKKGKILLDENGKRVPKMVPIKEKMGIFYDAWVKKIKELGYNYKETVLNAADYGAHTSRIRYFGIFYRKGLKAWTPQPTHSKTGDNGLSKWKACREKIDLENEGESIFARSENPNIVKQHRNPLVHNTLNRIAYGIKKYHLKDMFIMKYYGHGSNVSDIDEPLHTIPTKDRHFYVVINKSQHISKDYTSGGKASDINEPLGAILTSNKHRLVSMHHICKQQGQEKGKLPYNAASSVDEPLHTIMTSNRHCLISSQFISKAYGARGDGSNTHGSLDKPLGTITCIPHESIVTTKGQFITQNIHKSKSVGSIDEPIGAILTRDEKVLISTENGKFILRKESSKYNVGSLDTPAHCITTEDGSQVVTIVVKDQDKNSLHWKEKMEFFTKYFPEYDPELLCILIDDIKMRYLNSKELADITGFKEGTELGPTETLRKKHIGNAVPPVMSEVIIMAQWDGYGLPEVKSIAA